ncbi:MAG: hypothetical protein AMXMBFR84_08010 [Candidatus Hydrogenedentota bacterium]
MATEGGVLTKSTEIRVSGYGGQGVVLAGMLLGKAAALYDGKEAVFTQSYGPEARGGASCADIVVSDGPIDYPLVSSPDILVTLFQEAYVKYRPTLRDGGLLILESSLVHPSKEVHPYSAIDATAMADGLGKRLVMNVIVLGFLVGKTGVVSVESMQKAIESTMKSKTVELNLRAFEAGLERATKAA